MNELTPSARTYLELYIRRTADDWEFLTMLWDELTPDERADVQEAIGR